MSTSKDLIIETIASTIYIKTADHTIAKICNLTSMGQTSAKKYTCKFCEGSSNQLLQKKSQFDQPKRSQIML